MKKQYFLPFIIIACLTFQFSFAHTKSDCTVIQQLENLNVFWKDKDLDDPILKEKINLDEVSLIQIHLSLVEQKLRSGNNDKLTNQQRQNRIKCLDILREYWQQGLFPKNLYHEKRTPYFIDDFNTACAVGQLIRATGFEDLAQRIHKENNYGYILDLVLKYPEIAIWAEEYGFEINELAWIQPCYCNITTPGIMNVSCFGAYDGYFVVDPDTDSLSAPYTINYYYWYNNDWEYLWCDGCDLGPGEYKCEVEDANGTVQEYLATITEPDELQSTTHSTDNNGSCNGTASVEASGGTSPFSYLWSPGGQTSQTATDLCEGNYTVTITDANGCLKIDSIEVSFLSASNEPQVIECSLFPNPTNDKLFIQLNNCDAVQSSISIVDAKGEIVLTEEMYTPTLELSIASLRDGIYFVHVKNGSKNAVAKVMKSGF